MLSLSIEAGSLAEETMRQKSVSPGRRAGNGYIKPRVGCPDVRLEALEEPKEQVETIGALRKLSSISSGVATWFPYYGHKELRLGAGDAKMKIPDREQAEALARGTKNPSLFFFGGGIQANVTEFRVFSKRPCLASYIRRDPLYGVHGEILLRGQKTC